MNLSVMFTQDKISRLSKINYWSLNTAAVSLNPFETIKFRYKWDLPCNSGGDEIFAQVIKSVLHQILRQITNLVSPEGCREIKQNQSHVLYWNVDFSKKKNTAKNNSCYQTFTSKYSCFLVVDIWGGGYHFSYTVLILLANIYF